MNSKQIVLIGLVFTSLLISITLTDLLPGFIWALIILVIGIAVTYYVALYNKRLEEFEAFGILVKSAQDLHSAATEQSVVERLMRWAERAVPSEDVFVWLAQQNDFYPLPYLQWSGWEEVNRQVLHNKSALIINPADKGMNIENVPSELKSFAAVPFLRADKTGGILYLINKKEGNIFNKSDRQILENLSLHTMLVLQKDAAQKEMEQNLLFLIKTLLQAMESLIPDYKGHTERVTEVSLLIGEKLGLGEDELKVLQYSALLHDIGKLSEQTENGPDETAQPAKDHAVLGAELLPAENIWQEVRKGVLYHHERYDGSGYPEGLAHNDIPFTARIIAAADIYDAMTRLCPEENRLDHLTALSVIKKATGTVFDPLVVTAMEEVENELEEIYHKNFE